MNNLQIYFIGGNWFIAEWCCCLTYRIDISTNHYSSRVGFRIIKTV